MANESKKIIITYDDGKNEKEYTLMFNKWSARRMQENGFDITKAQAAPNVIIPDLFAGAFIAKQPLIKSDIIEKIFEGIRNKQVLFDNLIEMYRDTIDGLFDEPEDDVKNVEWTVS